MCTQYFIIIQPSGDQGGQSLVEEEVSIQTGQMQEEEIEEEADDVINNDGGANDGDSKPNSSAVESDIAQTNGR